MKILIGVTAETSSFDALALGAVFQRSVGGEVVLGNIHDQPPEHGGKRRKSDDQWTAYLRDDAQEVLDEAKEHAERYGLTNLETAMHGRRSSGLGLAELAESVGADLIVIGSAPGASNGRFVIGSTADRLLHGSPVPVALAPAGYRRRAPAEFARLVVGYREAAESHSALTWAGRHAGEGRRITVLTAVVRQRMAYTRLTYDTPAVVAEHEREDVKRGVDAAARSLGENADGAVAEGDDVLAALRRFDWDGDELLVLGSSSSGSLLRVFIGDMTYKLVRAATVPVIVLPHEA